MFETAINQEQEISDLDQIFEMSRNNNLYQMALQSKNESIIEFIDNYLKKW